MMQSLLAKEAGTYRPTYLPVFLILILLQSFLLPTWQVVQTCLVATPLSVCLSGWLALALCPCLGTYLSNLTDLPSPKFQCLSVLSVSLCWYLVPTYLPSKSDRSCGYQFKPGRIKTQ